METVVKIYVFLVVVSVPLGEKERLMNAVLNINMTIDYLAGE